jgi:TonB family protein
LAALVTGTALAGVAGGGGVLTALTFMSMNKISLGLSAALVAVGATGFVVQARTTTELRAELQQLQAESQQIPVLQAENLRLAKSAAEVEAMRAEGATLARLSEEAEAIKGRMQTATRRAAEVSASQAVYEHKALDHPPRLRSSVSPVYPAELLRAGVEGEVVVDFVVDAAGKVHNAYVVRSTQREFETATLEAVAQWEYDPGQWGGRAVNTHLQVPVRFTRAKGKAEAGESSPYAPEKKP